MADSAAQEQGNVGSVSGNAQLPPGAIQLSSDEVRTLQQKIISSWRPVREMFVLKIFLQIKLIN